MNDQEKKNSITGTVLIVDDDPEIREVVSEILISRGFEVREAENGTRALESVNKNVPDLILLDIRLPDIDGFEVCRRLRIREKSNNVPIIFLSGLSDTGDIVRAFSSGGGDYVVKPFKEKELISRIENHLERSRIQIQLEDTNIELEHEIAERKRVEDELRQSENRLRTAIESLPFDFFVIGRDGRYIMQNATLRQHGGDVIGKFPRDVALDKETLALWESNNQRAFNGEIVRGEEVIHLKEGDKYIYNIVSPIKNGEEIQGILGVNIDITELKWIKERLQKTSEAMGKLAKLVSECPHPVLRISKDGLILYANKESSIVLETWKCQVGQHLPQPFLDRARSIYESGVKSEFDLDCTDGSRMRVILNPDLEEDYLNVYGLKSNSSQENNR
jgi:PAS domain S-box-containing protein